MQTSLKIYSFRKSNLQILWNNQELFYETACYTYSIYTITKGKHFFWSDHSAKQIHCKRARLWHSSFDGYSTGLDTTSTLQVSTINTPMSIQIHCKSAVSDTRLSILHIWNIPYGTRTATEGDTSNCFTVWKNIQGFCNLHLHWGCTMDHTSRASAVPYLRILPPADELRH